MTPTSKIIGAVLLLALIGTTAFVLFTGDSDEHLIAPLGASDSPELEARQAQGLAVPDATGTSKQAVKPRVSIEKPVEETREDKLAKKRANGPWLKGRIIDAFGNPIEDAVVEVSSWQSAAQGMMLAGIGGGSGAPKESSRNSVKTGKDGRFSTYRNDKLGLDVSVAIGARGYLVSRERELLGEDGTLDLGDYKLDPAVVITGIVVDQNEQPVEGAGVKRTDGSGGGMFEMSGAILGEFGMGGLTGGNLTDAEGRFELPHEEPGEFELTVKHTDYPVTMYTGKTGQAGTETQNLVVRMKPGATIAGVLEGMPPEREKVNIYVRRLNAEADSPTGFGAIMGDVGLYSGGPSCVVESTGAFTLRGLDPGGRYELRAIEKAGMFSRKLCSEPVEADAGDLDAKLVFDAGASLSFQVVDSKTGEPLTDLKIRHTWADGSDMFSVMAASFGGGSEDHYPEGRVTLTELRPKESPGLLNLRVSSPGFLDEEREDISIADGADVELGTIRLRVAPRVRVHVIEAKTGKPIARARVRLRDGAGSLLESLGSGAEFDIDIDSEPDMEDMFDSKSATGKTDSDGWCELPAFEMDNGVIIIRSPKYSEYRAEGIHVNASGTKVVEAALVRGGEVEIVVADRSGRPVPGAAVRHRDSDGKVTDTKTTNKKGIVRFRRIQPGPHSFMAEHQSGGIRGMFGNVSFSSDGDDEEKEDEDWMTIGVVDGETSRLKLIAPGFATLEGVVTSNGIPLIGATVSLSTGSDEERALSEFGGDFGRMLANGGLTDVTNDNGLYEISSAPAGEYTLVVRHPKRAMPTTLGVKLREGDNRFDASLTLSGIEGHVIDGHGDPVAGARVQVFDNESAAMSMQGMFDGPMADFFNNDDEAPTLSGTDGSFVIYGVREDVPLYVTARLEGFVSERSEPVEVSEGEIESGLEIQLQLGGSILVEVTGTPEPFTMVQAAFQGEVEDGKTVAAKMGFVRNGKATLKNLREGPWLVKFARGEEGGTEQEVTVTKGERSRVTLTAP